MRTPIHEQHDHDERGNPSGGVTTGRGFTIAWQNGPLAVGGVRREPTGEPPRVLRIGSRFAISIPRSCRAFMATILRTGIYQ